MGVFGIEIGPSIDSLASDYANAHKLKLSDFANKKDLDIKLGDMYDECARYVHSENPLHGQKNSYSPCKTKIDAANATVVAQLTASEAAEDQQLKEVALAGNAKTYAIVALILIVMVAIVIIIK